MAYAPETRQTIRLDEGDVIVLLPADLSPKSIGILQEVHSVDTNIGAAILLNCDNSSIIHEGVK